MESELCCDLLQSSCYTRTCDVINKPCPWAMSFSVQLRQTELLFSCKKSMHAWCFETIVITNSYTLRSSKGIVCAYVHQRLTTNTLFPLEPALYSLHMNPTMPTAA